MPWPPARSQKVLLRITSLKVNSPWGRAEASGGSFRRSWPSDSPSGDRSPSGSRPYCSGRCLKAMEVGTPMTISPTTMASSAVLQSQRSSIHTMAGTRNAPTVAPARMMLMALPRCRTNQLAMAAGPVPAMKMAESHRRNGEREDKQAHGM